VWPTRKESKLETKEYYFTEKQYIPTARQAVLDVIVNAIRIIIVIEGFGFILFKTSHLRTEQLFLCLAIELVYKLIKRENIEISITSLLQIKEDEVLIKRVSSNKINRKESIISIPWYKIRKVFISDNYLRINGIVTHKLYMNYNLISDVVEKNMVIPLLLLKKEESEEIRNIFLKGARNGEDYAK